MKQWLLNVKNWIINHLPSKRRIIQLYAALLYNANIKGFISGNIYTGETKNICVPGLNCYSCPGAVGSCPLGALQDSLSLANKKLPYYIIGILLLYGLCLGRTICGFLCPVGLIQDLLYKIKSFKITKNRVTRVLSYTKYVVLAVFVIILPLMYGIQNLAVPAFCKYICPAGTFEGGIGLLANPNNQDMFMMLGPLFTWKMTLLILFIVFSILCYRFFCRFICPLGAIYSFFNQISFLGIKLNNEKCIKCGKCITVCKMDIKTVGDRECINCGDCVAVCPTSAITFNGPQIRLHKNQIDIKNEDVVSSNDNVIENENKKKKINTKRIIIASIASLVLIGSLVYFNFIDVDDNIIVYKEGDRCPDRKLKKYGDEDTYFSINDNLGKVTIINFWATNCGPCVQELPEFNELYLDYKPTNMLDIVAIHSVDIIEDVQSFIDFEFVDFEISFAQDNDKDSPSYFDTLGGKDSLPMTVIVDQNNIIHKVIQGKTGYSALKQEVDLLLNK